jgi:hypothetical protein
MCHRGRDGSRNQVLGTTRSQEPLSKAFGGENGIRNRPVEPDGPDPSAIVHVAPEATMPTDAPKCAIDGDPGRFGTLEGELLDDPRDAPGESGMALIEERVQREAVALVTPR